MTSHWSFGHLQLKLWAKEGSGVKLSLWDPTTVWLPTTKSRESTYSRRALRECNMALESSLRGLQLWFRPRPDQRSRARSYEVPKSRDSNPGQFRDSTLGVSGKSDIRAWVPRRVTKYTIGSKVVAYSRVWAMVNLVCPSARGKSQHPRVSRMLK
jgi:hypothetical protein